MTASECWPSSRPGWTHLARIDRVSRRWGYGPRIVVLIVDWLSVTRLESATLLSLPIAVVAACLGHKNAPAILAWVAAATAMHACGCVVNDLADRPFDRLDHRRSVRPITSGRMSTLHAVGLILALTILFVVATLALTARPWPLYLAFVVTVLGNWLQKRSYWHPLIFDVLWGASVGLPALCFGQIARPIAVLPIVLLAITLALFDTSATDIKDLPVDRLACVRSSALELGLTAVGAVVTTSRTFRRFVWCGYALALSVSLVLLVAIHAPAMVIWFCCGVFGVGALALSRFTAGPAIRRGGSSALYLLAPFIAYLAAFSVAGTALSVLIAIGLVVASAAAVFAVSRGLHAVAMRRSVGA